MRRSRPNTPDLLLCLALLLRIASLIIAFLLLFGRERWRRSRAWHAKAEPSTEAPTTPSATKCSKRVGGRSRSLKNHEIFRASMLKQGH